jgi:hypothetical protein
MWLLLHSSLKVKLKSWPIKQPQYVVTSYRTILVLECLLRFCYSSSKNYVPQSVFNIQKKLFRYNSNRGQFFRICGICFYNLLVVVNNAGRLCFLHSLVSKLLKTPSSVLEFVAVLPSSLRIPLLCTSRKKQLWPSVTFTALGIRATQVILIDLNPVYSSG